MRDDLDDAFGFELLNNFLGEFVIAPCEAALGTCQTILRIGEEGDAGAFVAETAL